VSSLLGLFPPRKGASPVQGKLCQIWRVEGGRWKADKNASSRINIHPQKRILHLRQSHARQPAGACAGASQQGQHPKTAMIQSKPVVDQSWVRTAWKDFLRVYFRHRTATNRIYVLFFVGLMLQQLRTSVSGKGASAGKKGTPKPAQTMVTN